ncbi:redoxin domain-containing protein [Kribbella sp. NBC_01245]|uniref:redoxin domain-containing protein n=1 Tax=Kribbella sp. NBC_01245 TaxID=2903578 RepID=UPI002E2CD62A|nr:redoxin domain-containing protein [Kribbella sp. NBC_01245]
MSVRRFATAAMVVALLASAGCGDDTQGADPGGSTTPGASTGATGAPTNATGTRTGASGTPTSAATGKPPSGGTSSGPVVVPESLKFTGTTLDGKPFDGASLAAKPAVLWFWAPWCPKCRAQAEATAKVANDYKGRVNVVGVAGLDKPDAMRAFVSDRKVGDFPHLSDEAGAIWKRFGVIEQSTYVVLDAKGNKVFTGNLPAGAGLSDKVAELVG